jgi:hypothetical protein
MVTSAPLPIRTERTAFVVSEPTAAVLGLRFFTCLACDTVYAAPDEPPWCDACDDGVVEEITDRVQSDPYFSVEDAGGSRKPF